MTKLTIQIVSLWIYYWMFIGYAVFAGKYNMPSTLILLE